MKGNVFYVFTIVASILFSINIEAQQSRIALVEHFTQASCFPCASYNPTLEALLNNNLDQAVSIKYQTSWPGFDPMHNHNPTDVNNRTSYYGIGGVPRPVLQGTTSGTGAVTQTAINNIVATASPFTIEATAVLTSSEDGLIITANVIAEEAVTGDLVAHIVVVEEEINFTSPPGSNGETSFFNVMKKMLPDANGTSLNDFEVNQSETLTEIWEFSNVYDVDQIAVVIFIQDNISRTVYQAIKVQPTPPISYTNNVTVLNISNVPQVICETEISPIFEILNSGTNNLTSLQISYTINGISNDYNWVGNLPYLQTTSINLPSISDLQTTNTLSILALSPNGEPDENPIDNTRNIQFVETTLNPLADFTITIVTDNYNTETYWDILDDAGNIVEAGGNLNLSFADAGTFLTPSSGGYPQNSTNIEDISLAPASCYTFRIIDSFGDGICCSYGNGSYTITDANGTIISGGDFDNYDVHLFKTAGENNNANIVQANVLFQGAYEAGSMITALATNQILSLTQPFNTLPWNYFGDEFVTDYDALPDNVVDWVLLELRDANNFASIVEQRAAFVQADGTIIDTDGITGVRFYNLVNGNAYQLVIRARNHLAIMSQYAINIPQLVAYNFAEAANVMGGVSQVISVDGVYVCKAGDFNGNGIISFSDFNLYLNQVSDVNQYSIADCTFDGNITIEDYNAYQINASAIGLSYVRY